MATTNVAGSQVTIHQQGNQVAISASAGIERLRYFTLDNPKRLVLDIFGVTPAESKRDYSLTGGFSKLRIGPYADKLRFVFDSSSDVQLPKFSVNRVENTVDVSWSQPAAPAVQSLSTVPEESSVSSIKFTASKGVSEYHISVDGPVNIDPIVKEGSILKFGLKNTAISRSLRRVYTSMAFPTAVQSITPYLIDNGKSSDIRFVVQLKGNAPYELVALKDGVVLKVTDGRFAEAKPVDGEIVPVPVDKTVRPKTKGTAVESAVVAENSEPSGSKSAPLVVKEDDAAKPGQLTSASPIEKVVPEKGTDKEFKGEKISLVFDNISVRNVLQLIAEVSNLNIIASDQIKGEVTLRLTDVPWDQALALVLDITNLGMIQEGNVVRVMPKDAIRSMKEAELTAVKSQEKLEPTVTEVITVSYATLGAVSGPAKKLLSDRGSITEDSRNKLLIVNDVPARINKIRELIKILDTPERQVMIEARIVEVNSNYSRDLGVNWGVDRYADKADGSQYYGKGQLGVGGDFTVGLPVGGLASTEAGLGAGMTFGRIGIDQTVLDLRISALESNGNAKVVSTPRVTTLNGEEATISQGTTIPYQTSGADGPKTEFIAAELKLTVKPVINPDNSVILEILATNDSPSITAGASAPSIDTKKAQTKVLVMDGETTVIGGIFINNKSESENGTPFLMHIPWLGHLFKSTKVTDTKAELMIFITPHILDNN
ncbi:type IV pilus secretin PilQ [Geopsychrobacter electrodiphilus]|uniref:type IV pilus secretin PilQ n=1 Tax=Geopsychrobacter electrodiphilus TaxID=225196 RepID=UPI003CCBB0B5